MHSISESSHLTFDANKPEETVSELVRQQVDFVDDLPGSCSGGFKSEDDASFGRVFEHPYELVQARDPLLGLELLGHSAETRREELDGGLEVLIEGHLALEVQDALEAVELPDLVGQVGLGGVDLVDHPEAALGPVHAQAVLAREGQVHEVLVHQEPRKQFPARLPWVKIDSFSTGSWPSTRGACLRRVCLGWGFFVPGPRAPWRGRPGTRV